MSLRERPLRACADGVAVPLLEFSWNSDTITLGHEIPIEKPVLSGELNRIQSLCALVKTSSFYVDIFPESKTIVVRMCCIFLLSICVAFWYTDIVLWLV